MEQIQQRLNELVDRYTGEKFKGCTARCRGFHLVRAFDEEIYSGLFKPYSAGVEWHSPDPTNITITVTGYALHRFTFIIQDKTDGSTDL